MSLQPCLAEGVWFLPTGVNFKTVTRTLEWSGRYFGCIYIYIHLFIPWSRVLLEKLIGSQPVQKFPSFYGTRRFIIAFTNARHLSLSWVTSMQSMPLHSASWRCTLILSSHLLLGLPSGNFPSGFPTKTLYTLCSPPHAIHVQSTSFFSIWSPEIYWVRNTYH